MSPERWSDSEVMQFGSMQTLLGHILPASHEHASTDQWERVLGLLWDNLYNEPIYLIIMLL